MCMVYAPCWTPIGPRMVVLAYGPMLWLLTYSSNCSTGVNSFDFRVRGVTDAGGTATLVLS